MTGRIINVRGSNASGKTTMVREFIAMHPESRIMILEIEGENVPVTECRPGAIYALGRYDRKNGGCDGYSGKRQIYMTTKALIEKHRPRAIIYEGMLYSKTTAMTLELISLFKPFGYKYKGIYLQRSFENTLNMLEARNEGRPYNLANIASTWNSCERAYKKLTAAGVDIDKYNPERMTKEDMGKTLLAEAERQ